LGFATNTTSLHFRVLFTLRATTALNPSKLVANFNTWWTKHPAKRRSPDRDSQIIEMTRAFLPFSASHPIASPLGGQNVSSLRFEGMEGSASENPEAVEESGHGIDRAILATGMGDAGAIVEAQAASSGARADPESRDTNLN
jgi:hypothetical protein